MFKGLILKKPLLLPLWSTKNLTLSHPFLCSSTPKHSFSTTVTHFNYASSPVGSGDSLNYLESLEEQYNNDPSSIDPSWASYFKNNTTFPSELPSSSSSPVATPQHNHHAQSLSSSSSLSTTHNSLTSSISALVRAYQVVGHSISDLDPLGIYDADLDETVPPELLLENYSIPSEVLNQPINIGQHMMAGFLSKDRQPLTIRQLYERLRETYSTTIGLEYMHILDRGQCNWIRSQVETTRKFEFSKDEKVKMLDRLMYSHHFETFLAQKYPSVKRFGLEGGESLIPGIKAMIDCASDLGGESFVIGMPHRGRLNVLGNVLRKPLSSIFSEFQGNSRAEFGSGDVKYHLGASVTKDLSHGNKRVHLSLAPNPSHLEAVDPVVLGKTRAKQFLSNDTGRNKNIGILIHGDASFSGQGVVYETMAFSNLYNYDTGGTIHIVVNNQIGFTTNPRQSRSSPYCTDIAKYLNAPVFHVNGDDVEAVVYVCQLAAKWKQQFNRDVVVDIICYRKYGHNELDEPSFTQPQMYKAISKQQPTLNKYIKKLVSEGTITQDEVEKMEKHIVDEFQKSFNKSKTIKPDSMEWYSDQSAWSSMKKPNAYADPKDTGISTELFNIIGEKMTKEPEKRLLLHRGVQRVMKSRKNMFKTGEGIDWAVAESLALGSLCYEGYHVRFSGQDVERGTFSHRHAVLVDQETEKRYTPLTDLKDGQGDFSINNSHLSEYAALGFEYGYSIEHPNLLPIWEAQFGDFANGAQIIFDQFISCGEEKWLRSSSLTVLLPHGMEGQGPEHSSGRLERYLQLSNEDPDTYPEDQSMNIQNANWQVMNLTVPGTYFHALRRQMKRDFRKPLVIMTPKSLLRYKLSVSSFEDIKEGTRFTPVIPEIEGDSLVESSKIKKILICSGKVYFSLYNYRKDSNIDDVAIVRIEQICPFPWKEVKEQLEKYPNAKICYVQEESQNYGAASYIYQRLVTIIKYLNWNLIEKLPTVVSRKASSSPATGFMSTHKKEEEQILEEAFSR